MAKRIAEKELTDRNWDQEDEAEEVGTFSVASEEVLKNRAIKKAKRRNTGLESDGGGAFKGFKGLVAPSGGGGFSGFGAAMKPLEGLSNGTSATSSPPLCSTPKAASAPSGSAAVNGPASQVDTKSPSPRANGGGQQPPAGHGSPYHKQLAALNCCVRDWIVKHVDSNPLCDLTPIFRDYGEHLASIERRHGSGAGSQAGDEAASEAGGAEAPPGLGAPKSQPVSTFSFHGSAAEDAAEKAEAPPEKKGEPAAAPTASFQFGQKLDGSVLGALSPAPLAGFSFSSGNSGLFGKDAPSGKAVAAAPLPAKASEGPAEGSDGKGAEDEDSDEPPKVTVTEVKEEDAFYSKKCKLFYKKDNEFREKGVGTLHLKPAANQKTQLLVRADTNLGNILLNVLIPPNMPCTRTGRNNVLIVCVPNPPLDEKNPSAPATLLVRVKTGEDADELHAVLLDKRGS
ncbi:nuclear pore complex protein Nup50 [Sorex araneus]|uniref:nuclear pore complex protein Nup50 n=1 Tax=Sorex araneus TaxID=42254 RepID=UPI00243346CA|nr:nuclear pore complex protein Nup50 [Sorex araneus]XP_054998555.1 nuclear pore complex protein Nup50 [Sorex araneus]